MGVGIVVAVLFLPVFDPRNDAHQGPSCLPNVKQAGLAQTIYAGDHDDCLPRQDEWIDASYPYAKNWGIYHCPKSAGQWGYAFNGALDRKKTPTNAAEIPLLYDSEKPAKNASDPFKRLPSVPRHGRQNTVAYGDGHVRGVTAQRAGSCAF